MPNWANVEGPAWFQAKEGSVRECVVREKSEPAGSAGREVSISGGDGRERAEVFAKKKRALLLFCNNSIQTEQ